MQSNTGGTSAHRDPPIDPPSMNQSKVPSSQVRSYSQAAKSVPVTDVFPERDQAIILSVIEDLRLVDYVTSVGKIIGPRNVIFASKVSNNRICIYLANTNLVDFMVSNHSVITVNNEEVHLRRLVTPAKRILFSNVSPNLPHNLLESAIRNIGLKKVSPVSFLRASLPGDEYGHVLSFRRQVYVHPDDTVDLPSSIVINHKDMSYRIFVSYDVLVCFACKQVGHIANKCPNQRGDDVSTDIQHESDDEKANNRNTTALLQDTVAETENNEPVVPKASETLHAEKRAASSAASLISQSTTFKEPLLPISDPTKVTSQNATSSRGRKSSKEVTP